MRSTASSRLRGSTGCRPPTARKPHSAFREYDIGFVHMDVKHLPKLQDRDGVTRKRYLYVAIDRASRYVHLAVKDDETAASAVAFLDEARAALPFRITHVLTDRGSCFTADGFEHACERHGVQHRKTKPYTPRTNGMVERFNGRRQRVLKGRSPDMVLRARLKAKPELAKPVTKPPDPDALPKALKVVAAAKEVSHPDN